MAVSRCLIIMSELTSNNSLVDRLFQIAGIMWIEGRSCGSNLKTTVSQSSDWHSEAAVGMLSSPMYCR